MQPLGRERVEAMQAPFVLLVHDWCKLSDNHPHIKPDGVQVTHKTDIGYDLTCTLTHRPALRILVEFGMMNHGGLLHRKIDFSLCFLPIRPH
ncbi:MAG: hypothetical protein AB7I48_18190 [Planctomycetaceae bacterium]